MSTEINGNPLRVTILLNRSAISLIIEALFVVIIKFKDKNYGGENYVF